MIALALALASSLTYGITDFLGGLMNRSVALLSVLVVSQTTGLVLLSAIVVSRGEGPPGGAFLIFAAISGLCEAVGVAALYRGLAVGMMSIVAPVAATAPVVPVVAGVALGEFPTQVQGVGIAFAVVGIALTSWVQPSGGRHASGVASSVLFGLLAALGHGGFFVAMDAASEGGVAWALFVARITAVTTFALVMLLRRAPLGARGHQIPVIALIGILIVCGDSMYAFASTQGLLSVVAVLSSLYPLVTIALARVFLGERIGRFQKIGVALCLAGIVAISGGAGGDLAGTGSHEAERQRVAVVEGRLATLARPTVDRRCIPSSL